MDSVSRKRALMPEGTSAIINNRSLAASNKRLAELLKPGMSVLDVGCGAGAITFGIAQSVGRNGEVLGVDNNPRLIEEANNRHGDDGSNNGYEVADTYALQYKNRFDIVTSSRVLQWLSQPEIALRQMIEAAKPGATILILDYNHEKIQWAPEPPPAFRFFYEQFLNWRRGAGMRNAIADELESMFTEAELTDIHISIQSETTVKGNHNFEEMIGIWAEVAASRGLQMVDDGYLSEDQRLAAEREYRQWVASAAVSQTMYLLAVKGIKPDVHSDNC